MVCGNLFTISQGEGKYLPQARLPFRANVGIFHEHPPSCSLPTPFSNMLQECHSDSDGKAKPRVTSNTSTFCMPSSSPFTLALPFTKGLKLPRVSWVIMIVKKNDYPLGMPCGIYGTQQERPSQSHRHLLVPNLQNAPIFNLG